MKKLKLKYDLDAVEHEGTVSEDADEEEEEEEEKANKRKRKQSGKSGKRVKKNYDSDDYMGPSLPLKVIDSVPTTPELHIDTS